MIRIKQLYDSLEGLMTTHRGVAKQFPDPLYIAWMVDCVFDGKAPPQSLQDKFPVIVKARQVPAFRQFWTAYKEVKVCLSNFQMVNMGVVSEAKRQLYIEQFRKEYPEEVPF